MRVTPTMISHNTLRNINQSYQKLGMLSDQMATQKKITRASQDPVVAMKGMLYRSQVAEVTQFKRNLSEVYHWMDTADSALDEATETLKRIRDLATQASNDSYDASERANIAKEIKQLRLHLESIANTKSGTKYIFNGTDTMSPPVINSDNMNLPISSLFEGETNLEGFQLIHGGRTFEVVGEDEESGQLIFQDVKQIGNPAYGEEGFEENAFQLKVTEGGEITFSQPNRETGEATTSNVRTNDLVIASKDAVSANSQPVEIELLNGVKVQVNINPNDVFSNQLFGDIIRLEQALEDGSVTGEELTGYIDEFFAHIDHFVSQRAELGARTNRVEMIENRILDQEISAKKMMSDNEDVDMEEVIMNLVIQENIHNAALAAGARIMQPSLLDFLR
ncbi:flagellar hook protein [Alkalihalobacillus alcalophilus ATCC 27647 = CGMCC 1.3604]|uniref:Flagellar hook protein n=1 Tax=Alkalihalobacillus alcalophilus ATCC 27647 = CGMCC 1.3604 TaxID=1218173 RepID=A0A094WMS9_ALKAL|nr:flagellar hook-associated protein FlgL [Alkalihalobacillus alcalophilus]KGA97238.1 flagellar hook protein [Alkalihalobacillus alcalophilus ATCC 27647 = CGMCC 1.3604]MED1561516.1 flagellar hook-associated protein FlgL [Alkalihalobacillus alcalophilus]THG89525.1 flagellar hook protein [Alkalihalobacillus alcalophilus ATCC 27647 = CGMCC 1.3604]